MKVRNRFTGIEWEPSTADLLYGEVHRDADGDLDRINRLTSAVANLIDKVAADDQEKLRLMDAHHWLELVAKEMVWTPPAPTRDWKARQGGEG